MDDRPRRDELAKLTLAISEGRIDRRAFTRRALVLGLSLSAVATIFTTYAAGTRAHGRLQEGSADATPGGTLRFARAEDSDSLDPVTTNLNVGIWVLMSVYDQLVRVAPSGVDLEPGLAERWEVAEDALTYTFHLRPDLKFSDGTPLKASDVKYSIERAKNHPTSGWTFTLSALEEVVAQDDRTVVMRLIQPWAPFLSDLAMFSSSIISEAFAKGNEERLVEEMMGSGPFALAEWQKGDHILLKKNEHYWEPGLPLLDEVRIAVIPDDNSRVLQLQGGEIDAMWNVPSSRVEELKQDPNLSVIEVPSTYNQYVILNNRLAPLDDVNVRLALNYATDKQALIEIVLFGVGSEATSFMPEGSLFWNDDLPGFPFDLAKAQEYMAASSVPNGFDLELMYLAGLVDDEQLCTALGEMWSQIGVNVKLTPAEQSIYYDTWTTEKFQAWISYFTYDMVDPDEIVAFSVEPESSNAFHTGWSNAEAVELAHQGAAEQDPAKRQEIYARIQEIFNEDAPFVLLYRSRTSTPCPPRCMTFGHPPTGEWDWTKTWIEQ